MSCIPKEPTLLSHSVRCLDRKVSCLCKKVKAATFTPGDYVKFDSGNTIIADTFNTFGEGIGDNIGSVFGVAEDPATGDIYIGGSFSSINGVSVSNVAKYDASTGIWSALGSGLDNICYCLAWDADNGILYAGGNFATAGGNAAVRVAAWNGTTWSALGQGLNNIVFSLTIVSGTVYAGGRFTANGDSSVTPIRQVGAWSGAAWSEVANGLVNTGFGSSTTYSLVWDSVNSWLYAGGIFDEDGSGNPVQLVAVWKGGAMWEGVGTLSLGFSNIIYSLALDGSQNLYAGGVQSTTFAYIGIWDGATWSTVGNGLNNSVYSISYDLDNDLLYAAGTFTTEFTSSDEVLRLGVWDGSSWETVSGGLADFNTEEKILVTSDNNLFVGSNNSNSIGDIPFNGTLWILFDQEIDAPNGEDIVSYLNSLGDGLVEIVIGQLEAPSGIVYDIDTSNIVITHEGVEIINANYPIENTTTTVTNVVTWFGFAKSGSFAINNTGPLAIVANIKFAG